jgi:Flp pilus assembly protein CpaB
VALGVLLTSGAVVAFALFTVTQSARTLVWVTGVDVAAGSVIERSDLVLVAVGADPGVELLERGEEDVVLGSVARGPIPAGTPLSPALVVPPGESVPAGFAVVGARLEPGQYPSSRMAAGDRVELLAAVPATGTDAELEAASSLGTATIWAVDDSATATTDTLFVSILVPAEQATLAANAADLDRLRLALVSASGSDG